ncbi:hypothetical protein B7R22_07515 [Subtercola boreus]|uniref:Cytoplasmic protein n=1 Tax=Subtercola boreus TaxID=120213 RepID=A0A3E0VZ83_9MICO|nr:MmcQ/YjbR family DNA-binding protein [Subtercola boreus]RFA15051.1 hypothetical protein B7R22_07515 [Subtercola boreus]
MDRATLIDTALRVAASFPAVTRGQPFGEGLEVFKVVDKVFAIITTSPAEPAAEVSGAGVVGAGTSGSAHTGRRAVVTLKCAPPHGRSLVRDHAGIIPGYHMNKEHWISLCPTDHTGAADAGADDTGATDSGAADAIDETLVEDLVGNSYDLIVAALPRARRPGV